MQQLSDPEELDRLLPLSLPAYLNHKLALIYLGWGLFDAYELLATVLLFRVVIQKKIILG